MAHKPIRRVITGHDGKNVAKVIREGPAANTKTPREGVASTLMWCTDTMPTDDGKGHFAILTPSDASIPPVAAVCVYPNLVPVAKKALLQGGGGLTLAEVAVRAGFSNQSHFCRHFKRPVGVTPGPSRMPARIA